MNKKELQEGILAYYNATVQAYGNWGRDLDWPEIHALHSGFRIEGANQTHHEEIKELTKRVVAFADINGNCKVLDAGCGTGVISFEVASHFPGVSVVGINIVDFQLQLAQKVKTNGRFARVNFSRQDYMETGFPSNIFDRVIFVESFAHAPNKKATLVEAHRILKPGGRLVFVDAFIAKTRVTSEELHLLKQVEDGFCLTPYITIMKMNRWLQEMGFSRVEIRDSTENARSSTRLMAEHAKKRLQEDREASETITRSRKGCIATYDLLERGVFGYYFIGADL